MCYTFIGFGIISETDHCEPLSQIRRVKGKLCCTYIYTCIMLYTTIVTNQYFGEGYRNNRVCVCVCVCMSMHELKYETDMF